VEGPINFFHLHCRSSRDLFFRNESICRTKFSGLPGIAPQNLAIIGLTSAKNHLRGKRIQARRWKRCSKTRDPGTAWPAASIRPKWHCSARLDKTGRSGYQGAAQQPQGRTQYSAHGPELFVNILPQILLKLLAPKVS